MKNKKLIAISAAIIMAVSAIPTSASADSWTKTDTGYTYTYTDGTTAQKGWLKIDKKTYYITADGVRKTGWLKTKTAKYYFDKNGVMYKNQWLTLKSGTKYYLQNSGKAATGVVTIDDIDYKFADDGKCLGENHHFILNGDTLCLHSNAKCNAAKRIDKDNYSEIDIGADEFDDYSKNGYWACGANGCNDKNTRSELPKPKK